MNDDELNELMGQRGGRAVTGLEHLRYALMGWVYEVYPEASAATLMLLFNDDRFIAVDAAIPGPRVKWAGFPRAPQARERIRAMIRDRHPDCIRAGAVFYLGGRRTGVLPIPLDDPPTGPAS